MTDLIRKSASELAELISKGEVSSVEVTRAHLDRSAGKKNAPREGRACMKTR